MRSFKAVSSSANLYTHVVKRLSPRKSDGAKGVAIATIPRDAQAAGRLGSTRGTVCKTLHDGRRKLRGDLDEHGFHARGK